MKINYQFYLLLLPPNRSNMKNILLPLCLCLFLACRNDAADTSLHQKINDLEYRITLLENQLPLRQGSSLNNVTDNAPAGTTSNNIQAAPPGGSNEPAHNNDETPKHVYSPRCQAITKKGSQCKRNARSGRYCWQHRG